MMMKRFSVFVSLAVLLLGMLSLAASAATIPLTIEDVWINDRLVDGSEVRGDLLRGNELEVEVKLRADGAFDANTDDELLADNLRVEVEINGDDHNDIQARTEAFDIEPGEVYYKKVTLQLPDNMDQDRYELTIEVSNRDGSVEKVIILDVNTDRHAVNIDDVIFSPGLAVEAGRSLQASVRLENNGEMDEENIKVTLDIEGIGSDADYIDEIEEDEEKMTEPLYVQIPTCTQGGAYRARVTVDYDEDTRTESEDFVVTVAESDRCAMKQADKTVITVGPESQNIIAGGNEAVYPIAITNSGGTSKTYVVQLAAGDWASTRLTSNVLVVNPGETKVTYAYVAAKKEAQAGENTLSVAVKSGDQTLKEIMLGANVVKAGSSVAGSLRQGLQVGFVVLVVLLAIIAIIFGLSRLKKNGDEKEDETYY